MRLTYFQFSSGALFGYLLHTQKLKHAAQPVTATHLEKTESTLGHSGPGRRPSRASHTHITHDHTCRLSPPSAWLGAAFSLGSARPMASRSAALMCAPPYSSLSRIAHTKSVSTWGQGARASDPALARADGGRTSPHGGLRRAGFPLERERQPNTKRVRLVRPGCRAVALPRRPPLACVPTTHSYTEAKARATK